MKNWPAFSVNWRRIMKNRSQFSENSIRFMENWPAFSMNWRLIMKNRSQFSENSVRFMENWPAFSENAARFMVSQPSKATGAAPRPAVCWRPFGAFWWGRWPVTWGSRPRLYAIAPSGLGEEGRHSPEGAPAYSLGREPQD